jgi:hypothetical protein
MALRTPNGQLFLNELDDEEGQARKFELPLYESGSYCKLVNHRHVYEPINLADLELDFDEISYHISIFF